MELIIIIMIISMALTFVENSLVLLIAVLIFVVQWRAAKMMEKRINDAIVDIKTQMKGPAVLGQLSKSVIKSLSGWWANLQSQNGKAVSEVGKALAGGGGITSKLMMAKTKEDKQAVILGAIGGFVEKKFAEEAKQQKAVGPEEEPPDLTDEEMKALQEKVPTPEEYKAAYDKEYGETINTVNTVT